MNITFLNYERHFNAILFSIAAAMAGYILISVYTGREAVVHIFTSVGFLGVIIALSLSLLNYILRFIRWQMYFFHLGYTLNVITGLDIYFSGFAFTTTPGKAGEAIRSLFLKKHGIPVPTSMAVLLSERFSDLTAIVLLSCFGMFHYPQARLPILVTISLIVVFQLTILYRALPDKIHTIAQSAKKCSHFLHHIADMIFQVQKCNTYLLLLLTIIISTISWGAEGLAFYLLLQWTGFDLSLNYAVFVYAVSMLAGAVTFLPGGLGGTEGAMISLLLLKGVDLPSAVALTIFIRLTTLWFAVLLGILALYRYRLGGKYVS